MISRRQKRQNLREGLDALVAQLSAGENAPTLDLDQFTIHERQVFDALCEKSTSEEGWDFSKISYEQKKELLAILRKGGGEIELVSPWTPDDRRDVAILAEINARKSPVEQSDLRQ